MAIKIVFLVTAHGAALVVASVVGTWVALGVNLYIQKRVMNTLRIFLLLMVSILCVCESTFAQKDLPANDASTAALVELCKNLDDPDGRSFCFGFGEGVYQAYFAQQKSGTKPSICFPEQGDTREEILQKFLSWNKVNPQFNTERADKTLTRFFAANYLCK
jgi:hypothetical protein